MCYNMGESDIKWIEERPWTKGAGLRVVSVDKAGSVGWKGRRIGRIGMGVWSL